MPNVDRHLSWLNHYTSDSRFKAWNNPENSLEYIVAPPRIGMKQASMHAYDVPALQLISWKMFTKTLVFYSTITCLLSIVQWWMIKPFLKGPILLPQTDAIRVSWPCGLLYGGQFSTDGPLCLKAYLPYLPKCLLPMSTACPTRMSQPGWLRNTDPKKGPEGKDQKSGLLSGCTTSLESTPA